jgi:hypothetical protein
MPGRTQDPVRLTSCGRLSGAAPSGVRCWSFGGTAARWQAPSRQRPRAACTSGARGRVGAESAPFAFASEPAARWGIPRDPTEPGRDERQGPCHEFVRGPRRFKALGLVLFLLFNGGAQPILGQMTKCPVAVEVVDMAWAPVPGIDVRMVDERTRSTQTSTTNESGRADFVVQSSADGRCRFTISAGHGSAFKTVTLKHLWFGEYQNLDRHVQIRLSDLKGPTITIR